MSKTEFCMYLTFLVLIIAMLKECNRPDTEPTTTFIGANASHDIEYSYCDERGHVYRPMCPRFEERAYVPSCGELVHQDRIVDALYATYHIEQHQWASYHTCKRCSDTLLVYIPKIDTTILWEYQHTIYNGLRINLVSPLCAWAIK